MASTYEDELITRNAPGIAREMEEPQSETRPAGEAAAAPGRLIAVTATGPIYRAETEVDLVPISVGLAFLQELALRALYPESKVASSLAREVSGEEAYLAWAAACGTASAPLIGTSPRARLAFLEAVLDYVGQQGNANGIEPILGAAINAAWPWLETPMLERILSRAWRSLGQSEFAKAFAIPVFDANNRTCTLFAPGGLAKTDPSAWLDRHAFRLYAPTGILAKLSAVDGVAQDWLDKLNGGAGSGKGRLGGLRGPNGRPLDGGGDGGLQELIDGLLGGGAAGKKGGGPDGRFPGAGGGDGLEDVLGRLLAGSAAGTSMGGLGNVPGPNGQPSEGPDPMAGLFGGLLTGPKFDVNDLKKNGGPLGFGSNLSVGGAAAGWGEWVKAAGDEAKSVGDKMTAFGIGAALGGYAATFVGGGKTAAGVAVGGVGMFIWGNEIHAIGTVLTTLGEKTIREDAKEAQKKEQAEKAAADKAAADKAAADKAAADKAAADKAAAEKAKKDKTPEPKKKSGEGSLYPDPDGGGGGGDPTQLPRSDGSGGGKPNALWGDLASRNPAALWDENGGGGTPTTIWDKEGDGGTPTTTGVSVAATVSTGRGVLAGVMQVGPATFAF